MFLLRVQVVSDPTKAWDDIESFDRDHPGSSPFVRRAWLESWLDHARPNHGRPEFLLIRDEDRLVAYIACWVDTLALGPEIYRFMGEGMSNELDISSIAPMDEVFAALESHFRQKRRGAILRLYDVEDGSTLAKHVAGIPGSACIELYRCPRVELTDGWEAYRRDRLNSKRRSDLSRRERRLASLGRIELVSIRDAASLAKYRHLVSESFELHRQRFESVLNTSGFSDPRMRPFYDDLIARTAEEETLYLSILTIQGRAASFVLALAKGTRLIDCIPAFDPSLAPFGVGHIHMHHLLRALPDQGIDVFDFSKGEGTYKAKWANGGSANLRLALGYRLTRIGRGWFAALNAKDEVKVYLRHRGVNERVKSLVGAARYRLHGSPGATDKEPTATLTDPAGLELTRSVTYDVASAWSLPLRSAVYRAIATGALAYVLEGRVAMVWPDRAETIALDPFQGS